MTQKTADKTGTKKAKPRGKPFPKGVSGNPSGRPEGSRNRVSVLMDGILQGQAEALLTKAVEDALAGDTSIMKTLIDKLMPSPKDRPVSVALPAIKGVSDLPRMTEALLSAVSGGDLTPLEAAGISKTVDAHRAALELVDIESRLSAIEIKLKEGKKIE